MKDKVIIFVSDSNYIEHVKSATMNCINQGNYTGDFAVICPAGIGNIFRDLGYYILETEQITFLQKFSVFHPFFRQWSKAMYLDCDILVQDNLDRLFNFLDVENKIWMDREDCTTIESFWRDSKSSEHPQVYEWMQTNYPVVNLRTFNSSVIVFRPEFIPEDTVQRLLDIQAQIEPANNMAIGGTDQQVINLLLWDKCRALFDKAVCFWGLAEPQNDVDCESRLYKQGDSPAIVHYSRWYAPWIDKTEEMDARICRRLNRPAYDIYIENLNSFKPLTHG